MTEPTREQIAERCKLHGIISSADVTCTWDSEHSRFVAANSETFGYGDSYEEALRELALSIDFVSLPVDY